MKNTNEWHLVHLAEYCDGPPTTWQKLQWLYGEFAMDLTNHQLNGTLDEWLNELTGRLTDIMPPWNLPLYSHAIPDAGLSSELLDWIAKEVGYEVSVISPLLDGFCQGNETLDSDSPSRCLTVRAWSNLLLTGATVTPNIDSVSMLYIYSQDFLGNIYDTWEGLSHVEFIDGCMTAHVEWDHVRNRLLDLSDEEQEVAMALLRLAERLANIRIEQCRWSLFTHLVPHHVPQFCRGEVPPLPHDLTFPVRDVGKLEDEPEHVRKAVQSYIAACKEKQEFWDAPSRDVYQWLKHHKKDPGPSLETWQRYIRQGSKYIEAEKQRSRSRRMGGAPRPPHKNTTG
jgi:hypothetical protein